MSEQGTSHADFTLGQLYQSTLPGDRQLAMEADKAIAGIVEKLKPVLVFLCAPTKVKFGTCEFMSGSPAVELMKESDEPRSRTFYLNEQGQAVIVCLDEQDRTFVLSVQDLAVAAQAVPFSRLMAALNQITEAGTEKAGAHRDMAYRRQQMMRQIMEAIDFT